MEGNSQFFGVMSPSFCELYQCKYDNVPQGFVNLCSVWRLVCFDFFNQILVFPDQDSWRGGY